MKHRVQENTKKNPGVGEIFFTRPDRPWGPPGLLYDGYRVCFPGLKLLGLGANHPFTSSAEVEQWSYTSAPTVGLHGLL